MNYLSIIKMLADPARLERATCINKSVSHGAATPAYSISSI